MSKLWETEPSWQHHVAAEINNLLGEMPKKGSELWAAMADLEAPEDVLRAAAIEVIVGFDDLPSRIAVENACDDSWEKNR